MDVDGGGGLEVLGWSEVVVDVGGLEGVLVVGRCSEGGMR